MEEFVKKQWSPTFLGHILIYELNLTHNRKVEAKRFTIVWLFRQINTEKKVTEYNHKTESTVWATSLATF